MQEEDDTGDLDETQAQEPDSKRLREGETASDLLQRCAQDAENKVTCDMEAYTSKLLQEADVREQRTAERIADRETERDAAPAAKLESLMKALSESVDSKISNLSATVDGKLENLEQKVQERWKTFEDKWTEKDRTPRRQRGGYLQC